MGLPKNQTLVNKYEYDFSVSGGAVSTIAMTNAGLNAIPAGVKIERVMLVADTLLTSAGTPTVTIGNTTDADGYFADVWALMSGSGKASIVGGEVAGDLIWDDTNDHGILYSPLVANDLDFNVTIGTAALTAGKLSLYVEYKRI